MLGVLIAAVLQAAAAPAASAAPPPAPEGEVTVYGKIIRDAPHLVKRFGHATSGDRLARWRQPVCAEVHGLDAKHDQWVAARMMDLADSLGARVDGRGCDPNIIVIVSRDDGAVRADLAKHAYDYMNFATNRPVDKNQLFAFTKADDLPAHLFYATGVATGDTGSTLRSGYADSTDVNFGQGQGPPVVRGGASRLIPMTEPSLTRVFLVLDGKRLVGKSLLQIAAYATLVTLAEVRTDPPLRDPESISALFTDTPPPDLTLWDRAYLQALYRGASQINLNMQQSVLADQMADVVRASEKAAAGPARP